MHRSLIAPISSGRKRSAFTLLEVVMVMVILSVLTLMVVPLYRDVVEDSEFDAVAATVQHVQSLVRTLEAESGTPPPTILSSWFADGQLPTSPFRPDHPSPIFVDGSATPAHLHPADKRIGGSGVFWYNPTNGYFRALVEPNGAPAIVTHYNMANKTAITSATQTN